MSHIAFLRERFAKVENKSALIWNDKNYTYGYLLNTINDWRRQLEELNIYSNSVVSVSADFSPNTVALLLALIEWGCTVVPLTESVNTKREEYLATAKVDLDFSIDQDDRFIVKRFPKQDEHPLYKQLWASGHPGLVLFSSGSTGASKAILHNFTALLEKFKVMREAKCTITFLLFDHIGGMNTLLHTLSNLGTVVIVKDRSPDAVCRTIEQFKVQILPTSPTFLNLLMLSGALNRYDLSSLDVVTYGTEVMPESVLHRFHQLLPKVDLRQTYGLSEIGILRSKSESSNSLWMKLGGEGFQTRVVDNLLEIKSASTMLGYLNAESPFTEDGWLKTGDMVEEKNGYFRVLGRKSEIINVGGEKVFPAEVESVLQKLEGVVDVFVYGEPNAITGNIVAAKIYLNTAESLAEFRKRMIEFCRNELPTFKIPQKVSLVTDVLHGGRFKKIRSQLQRSESIVL